MFRSKFVVFLALLMVVATSLVASGQSRPDPGLNFILIFLPSVAFSEDLPSSPVSGVDVTLENRSGANKTSAKTDAEGNFSVSGLEPGTYKLRMSCNDCRYEGKTSYEEQKYFFYVAVEGVKQLKFKKTVGLDKMLSGVEYTVKIAEGSKGTITGKITGAWDKPKIKPPTIKPPTE